VLFKILFGEFCVLLLASEEHKLYCDECYHVTTDMHLILHIRYMYIQCVYCVCVLCLHCWCFVFYVKRPHIVQFGMQYLSVYRCMDY